MQTPFSPPLPLLWRSQSLLMKIDAFHYVQLGTAYRSVQIPGRTLLPLHPPLYRGLGSGLLWTLDVCIPAQGPPACA